MLLGSRPGFCHFAKCSDVETLRSQLVLISIRHSRLLHFTSMSEDVAFLMRLNELSIEEDRRQRASRKSVWRGLSYQELFNRMSKTRVKKTQSDANGFERSDAERGLT
jgi:hypothetical protein